MAETRRGEMPQRPENRAELPSNFPSYVIAESYIHNIGGLADEDITKVYSQESPDLPEPTRHSGEETTRAWQAFVNADAARWKNFTKQAEPFAKKFVEEAERLYPEETARVRASLAEAHSPHK